MPAATNRSISPIHKKRTKSTLRNIPTLFTSPPPHSPDHTLASPSSVTDQEDLNAILSNFLTPYMQHAADATTTPPLKQETSQVSEESNLIDVITASNDFIVLPSVNYTSLWSETSPMSRETRSDDNRNPPPPPPRRTTPPTETTPSPPPAERPTNRPPRGRRTAPTSNLRCDICHQFYSRRDNLRVHQRVHSGERPYQCAYCHKPFRWLGALRTHESNHQRDGDQIQPRTTTAPATNEQNPQRSVESLSVLPTTASPSQLAPPLPLPTVASSPVSANQPQMVLPQSADYVAQAVPHLSAQQPITAHVSSHIAAQQHITPAQVPSNPLLHAPNLPPSTNAHLFPLQMPHAPVAVTHHQPEVAQQIQEQLINVQTSRPLELSLDLLATTGQELGNASPGPFVSEEDPGDSPLFAASQNRWPEVLDDTIGEEHRENTTEE